MRVDKITIAIIVIATVLIAVIFGIKKYNWIHMSDYQNQIEDKIDLEKLGQDYQSSLRAIMPEYNNLISKIQDNTATIEMVNNVRQKMLELQMPAEFKSLHIELIMMLENLEKSISEEDKKLNYQEVLDNIKSGYSWLVEKD